MACQSDTRTLLPAEWRVGEVRDPGGDARRSARGEWRVGAVDHLIARLAGEQHELVGRRQLLAAGVAPVAIRHRLDRHRLYVVHRGVYTTSHAPLTLHARFLAAVLAAGPGSVISHLSAAVRWGLLRVHLPWVEVTGPTRCVIDGIVSHRGRLERKDVRRKDAIPVTSPTRIVLDLARTPHLERALREARLRGLVSPAELLDRSTGRRGARRLRALLVEEPRRTRSEAERLLLRVVRRAGLPLPRTNLRIRGHEVDAVWPAQRVIVEVDGYAFHGDREAFERDRRRDQDLVAAGYRVLRTTWRQLSDEPEAFAIRLVAALARS